MRFELAHKAVAIFVVLFASSSGAVEKADLVIVDKSEETLTLLKNAKALEKFHVVFGGNPKGHKQREGDERTPEGNYTLDYKKSDSAFYKAIHISYPNADDKRRAEQRGVSPGGLIMIHGQRNGLGWLSFVSQGYNWTDGCIAVTNREMDKIWELVDAGTPITIKP